LIAYHWQIKRFNPNTSHKPTIDGNKGGIEIKEEICGMETDERLYHYTTWEGLWGILQTPCLWATHYKFLNDYSEILLFKPKLKLIAIDFIS
jgi:hypothetical protein